MVICPELLRPECLVRATVNLFSAFFLVKSKEETTVVCRLPEVVGL
jgi:hypothetical protein